MGFVKHILAAGQTEHIFASHRSPLGSDSAAALEDLAKAHKNVHLVQLDMGDEKSRQQAVKEVEKIVGDDGLNVLVNNSGMLTFETSLESITQESLSEQLQLNTVSTILVLKAFHPLLKRAAAKNSDKPLGWQRGAVLYTSSILGSLAETKEGQKSGVQFAKSYGYRGSKAALNMIAYTLSYELQAEGILSASVNPGWVRTDMGGDQGELSVEESIQGYVAVAQNLRVSNNGLLFNFDGNVLPW